MTEREIASLDRDARKPDYGAKFYKPHVVMALIEELRKARLFAVALIELKRAEPAGDVRRDTEMIN